jgi:competence CoiA-like predicted nuclease
MEARRQSTFLEKESYMHDSAKKILFLWLSKVNDDVSMEDFYGEHPMCFRPDISVKKNGLIEFWEVVHKSDVTGEKIGKMQYYSYLNNINVVCYRVSARWIMNQIGQPQSVKSDIYFIDCKK